VCVVCVREKENVCMCAWCVMYDSFFIGFGVHDEFHEILILSLSMHVCVCVREKICAYVRDVYK